MTILIPEDEPIFRRVLNLCNNAAQAMEGEGGSLGINLKNVTVNERLVSYDQILKPGEYGEGNENRKIVI